MNFNKIQAKLGWAPNYDLEFGLKATVKWYLNNQSWIESVSGNVAFQDWMNKNYINR
jgi:dTDP-glucose 4,6-dehydratase